MSVPTNRAQAAVARSNLYDEITGKIIAELEGGRFPLGSTMGDFRRKRIAFPAEECQHASRV